MDDAYLLGLIGVSSDLDELSFIFYFVLDGLGLYGIFMAMNMEEILGYGI